MVHAHIVHLHVSRENGAAIGVAVKVAPHRQVHEEIKRLVERGRVSASGTPPRLLRLVKRVVHVPTELVGGPFHRIHVKIGNAVSARKGVGRPVRLVLTGIRRAKMQRPHHTCRNAPLVLHDINLPGGGPPAINGVHRHQPQRRPIASALRQFHAEFEPAIERAEKTQGF